MEEEEVTKEHVEGESCVDGVVEMENGGAVLEMEIDFKPIEHPPEPPDDDQPIKCPLPDPMSLIVDEVFDEPCTESLQTIAELLKGNETSTENSSGTDENETKHETVLPELATDTKSAHKSPHHKIFQVFQQCKELHV
ncbi:Cystic fibrosis transmembrane conductance regulator [Rhynchospora pubera]|uniref:Cystic fibrosis transmembrane conductance regulator n=1 Tax=Rhynchospora pubera TaxID=906938 RepID=A0AAV8BRQ8_9POAL|nr:Cystic fibrosis transmembrane conductance regulator [Rhynchospora pubera]